MNISTIANKSGLPPKTIRYYEEIGLISPNRKQNGYRDYSETDGIKLHFLQRARSLNFSIEDCRKLLSLYEDKTRASADVKQLAQAHLKTIERKIYELKTMQESLNKLVASCHGDNDPDCTILDGLSGVFNSTDKSK